MRFISLDDIIVPSNRIRRNFDLQEELELVNSIVTQGLFHPILLRPDGKTLIAGERRLRAIRQMDGQEFLFDGQPVPLGQAPTVTCNSSDAAGHLEAELNENLRRQQLTWQEQALATSWLHKLRQEQNPQQTIADTAEEVYDATGGYMQQVTSEDITLADHLDDPDVAKAPSRKEAIKVVARKKEDVRRKKLAAEFGVVSANGNATLIRGDLFTVVPELTTPFDLIIADPPYGVDAGEWDNQSAVEHTYSDTPEQSDAIYSFLAGPTQLILRNEAHAYLFCDARRFPQICAIFSSSGWDVWPWPLIWHRGTSNGLVPRPFHGPRRTYDCICFAIKGGRRTTGVYPDVLIHPHDTAVEFGAHKPVGLYQDLIRRSCVPGNRVLDPCAGSGPVLDAAKREHVWVTAIEIDESAHGQAVERLRKL